MHKRSSHIPFYRQMIDLLRNAFDLLDEQGRAEVLQFVLSQQNPDGGFQDRGGRSDLYYSLFGMMMLRAVEKETGDRRPKIVDRAPFPERSTEHSRRSREAVEGNPKLASESILKLRQFVAKQSVPKLPGFIEKCCLVLLQKDLKTDRFSRIKALYSLGKSFWKERDSINLSYRSFVLFLTLDAVLPFPGILILGAKRMLARTIVDPHSPCSEVAAKVFLQKMMNQDSSKEQELLMSFGCESGGFKAFSHLQQADTLSTAVALFALNFVGSDLRLMKPACFDFIREYFSDGAFLSGDGDQTADVEYTFYGLLALGVLAD
ncbi:MAG: prenyltransferase/squalene oxidase repeat-containing protein [Bacteroidota bacterium]|nr:prenyltransferase/squalene oxidase repeat-containing protein [Bacteroidota bacterium]